MDAEERQALKSFKEDSRSYYAAKADSAVNWLVDWGVKNRAYIKVVNDRQVTVSKNGIKLNIYPKSKRYYSFNKKKWGDYKNILHFLNSIYGKI